MMRTNANESSSRSGNEQINRERWRKVNRLNELVYYFDFVTIVHSSYSYLAQFCAPQLLLLIRDTLYTNNVVISALDFVFHSFFALSLSLTLALLCLSSSFLPVSKTRTIYRETSIYVVFSQINAFHFYVFVCFV